MANFFPRWTNWLPHKIMICGVVDVTALVGATWYYDTPKYTRVGYMPTQPVPFPHDLHVTQLGMDGAVARIRGVSGTKLAVGVKRGEQVSTLVVERKPVKL